MALLPRFASGLRALIAPRRAERELDDELHDYLNESIEQKMSGGMGRDAATRAARLEMGSITAVKDNVRDVGWEASVDAFLQDLRFALRWFIKAPRFTVPALLALALGIGVTSAIFSVVRGVMLSPLPYRNPERIVGIWETNRGATSRNVIAPANFVEWRARNRSFEYLGATAPSTATIVVNRVPERVEGAQFSADAFNALGVQPAIGRAYSSDEDLDPDNSVVVISHEFWQTRLGGRGDVLGAALTIGGRRRTVIGVMPRGFTVTGRKAHYLLPYGVTMEQMRAALGRGSSYAVARLRDGVSLEQATAEMRQMAAQLEKEAPERNARRSVMLFPLQEQMVGDLRPAATALIGAVVLVLLVACVNVANLLLARSVSRERELGMRTALGAGRARLIRQMLTESLVLAAAGGAAGLMLAAWFHRGLLALVGDRIPIPRLDQVALDLPMVAFTFLMSLATGVVFGLAPAFMSSGHAADGLRDAGRHGGSVRLRRMLNALVVVEVALSLVLLAGAGLLMRSFVKLQHVDPGFRTDGVLMAQVSLPAVGYDAVQTGRFFRESISRLSQLPGAHSVAATACMPLAATCAATSTWRLDRPAPAVGQAHSSHIRGVTPGFFRTLEIATIDGRDFSDADTADALPAAIVSASFARLHFPAENPIGHQLHINGVADARNKIDNAWTIVGVVDDIKAVSLDSDAAPTVYVPHAQLPARGLRLLVRTDQDPAALANSLTRIIRSIDPEVPVSDVRTLEDFIGSTIARPRAISLMVAVFAVIALALAAVGVYGVMAFSVVERTHEIGVRMALGANESAVFRLVIGQAIRSVILGIGVGLVAAVALTRLLEGLLFQTHPTDALIFSITPTVLLIVAVLASYLPARRGMRIPPVEALRTT
jgi:putative ABC transport system permease protein